MKKKSTSQSAPARRSFSTRRSLGKGGSAPARRSFSEGGFFNLRILTASVFCLVAIAVALFAQGNRTKQAQTNRSTTAQDAPGTQRPDVVQMVGPVMMTTNLRDLPYVPNPTETEEQVLTRYPHGTGSAQTGAPAGYGISG